MSVHWYTLYGFVVGREDGDHPRYWFYNYIVLPQGETAKCQRLEVEVALLQAREVAAWEARDQYLEQNVKLKSEIERLRTAICATASDGNYDEAAIRRVVSFELAEIIVETHERNLENDA